MTPDQRTKLTQGIVYGVFFGYLGYFMKDVTDKYTAPYYGGIVGMVCGILILCWGLSHYFASRRPAKSSKTGEQGHSEHGSGN